MCQGVLCDSRRLLDAFPEFCVRDRVDLKLNQVIIRISTHALVVLLCTLQHKCADVFGVFDWHRPLFEVVERELNGVIELSPAQL